MGSLICCFLKHVMYLVFRTRCDETKAIATKSDVVRMSSINSTLIPLSGIFFLPKLIIFSQPKGHLFFSFFVDFFFFLLKKIFFALVLKYVFLLFFSSFFFSVFLLILSSSAAGYAAGWVYGWVDDGDDGGDGHGDGDDGRASS